MNGDYFRRFRFTHNLTQQQIADSLHISVSEYNKIENNKKDVSDVRLRLFFNKYQDVLTMNELEEFKLYFGNQCAMVTEVNTFPLKEFRKQRNLTQVELARLLDISPSYISAIENGTVHISSIVMKKIENVFEGNFSPLEKELADQYKSTVLIDSSRELVGKCLKNIRSHHKITMEKLSKDLGVSINFVYKIEHAQAKFPKALFEKFLVKYENVLTEEEVNCLCTCISQDNPNLVNEVIQNLFISNELMSVLYSLMSIHLEKEDMQTLFSNLLEEAKKLQKTKQ